MKSALTRRTLPVVPCQGQNAVDLLAATQHAKLCAGERKGLQANGGKKQRRGGVKEEEEEEELHRSLGDAVDLNVAGFFSCHCYIL